MLCKAFFWPKKYEVTNGQQKSEIISNEFEGQLVNLNQAEDDPRNIKQKHKGDVTSAHFRLEDVYAC